MPHETHLIHAANELARSIDARQLPDDHPDHRLWSTIWSYFETKYGLDWVSDNLVCTEQ